MNLSAFEKKIGFVFKSKDLLKESLTHRSYVNENPNWGRHNERMEFLGDAVLELIVSDAIYQKYPRHTEGELTVFRSALINYQKLAQIARQIDLENYLFLSRGEAKDTGKAREVILANAMEALIAAVYLDSGYQASQRLVQKILLPCLDEIVDKKLFRDPKSLLQEVVQEKFKLTPDYKVLGESGPDHQKIFRVGVYFGEDLIAEGRGLSKQEAEINAAEKALSAM